jgi:sugar lactone lactonase YvrE
MTPKTIIAAIAFSVNALCLMLSVTCNVCAQSFSVSTFAGLPDSGSADGLGLAVRFYLPTSLSVDAAGNVFVADTENDTIRMISPARAVSTVAGTSQLQGTNDGAASHALFAKPFGVALDSIGNVFVADTYNHTVREIFASGETTTLAGTAGVPGFRNGPAIPNSLAGGLFNYPYGIAVDANENIYVADALNNMIRKISHGNVTTLAGAGASGSADGVGTNALFSVPVALAVDGAGNVYVADYGNNLLRRVSPLGVVTTLAGLPGVSGSANGNSESATFFQPSGIAVDNATNLYVADTGNDLIRKITPNATTASWTVTTLAGTDGQAGDADGNGTNASFDLPQGVAVDGLGHVYVGDSINRTIRVITPGGCVSTLAGPGGSYGSADGPAASARFDAPYALAFDSATNLYVADTANDAIRKISPAGEVTTLAGLAGAPGSNDGTNGGAQFDNPTGIAVDASGNLYVADYQNSTVRKIKPGPGTNWTVSTLAGTAGLNGFSNGPVTNALFNHPYAIAVDGATNVYVTDYDNQVVRLISASGIVSTYAGNPGASGFANGTGSNALFDNPTGLALDSEGNLYVADSGNDVLRKIAAGGVTSTVAGEEGVSGSANGSPGLLNSPLGVAVDASNNVFVADSGNNTIREMAAGGGSLSTVAATARFAGSADGLSNAAQFNTPIGLAVDSSGDVFVADVFNNAIRKMTPYFGQAQVLTPPPNQTVTAGQTTIFSPLTAGEAPVTYQWLFDGTNIPGATLATLTLTNVQTGSAGTYQLSVSNNFGSSISAATVLKVVSTPTITIQPGTLAIAEGSNGVLGVAAFGAAPLNYQWSFDGSNLNDATNAVLAINNVTAANAGGYQVMVSNAYGSILSLIGALQLQAPPQILAYSSSQESFPGANVQLTVAANGTTPLLYQWLKNGTNLIDGGDVAGSTTPTLGLGPISAGDTGQYSVIVSNALGVVTSSTAMLSLGAPGAAISVFGFNRDVVVENSANPDDTRTSDYALAFDIVGPFAFYETNLPDAISYSGGPGHHLEGLPESRSFISQWDGVTVFQFASYTARNVLFLTPSAPSGSLSLSAPAAYDSLSILAASANGGGLGSFVLEFGDGSTSQPMSFNATDYYIIAASALTHFGRIYCGYYNAFYTDDYPGAAPNFYQTTIDLNALGLNTKPVASVIFTMPNGPDTGANTTTGIFALSGTPSVALQNPQAAAGSINFTFQTVANQSYTIEQTTNLIAGSWQVYQQVTGDGSAMQITAAATNTQQFFRVIQP